MGMETRWVVASDRDWAVGVLLKGLLQGSLLR